MSLAASSDLPKKGAFYKAKKDFYALNTNKNISKSMIKIPKDSHILVTRGGKNIQFSAKPEKRSPIFAMVSLNSFLETCVVSEAIIDPSDITDSYTMYKVKHLENGGFSFKLLENNIIIGDVYCPEYNGSGVPNIKLTPIASCSFLGLKKKIKKNEGKRHSLKTFLYYLYLGYSGFIPFDEFCRKI